MDRVLLVPLITGNTATVQIPATINQYLRDYQREGAQFMYNRYREGEGCILGDDMGLGKTVQVNIFNARLVFLIHIAQLQTAYGI